MCVLAACMLSVFYKTRIRAIRFIFYVYHTKSQKQLPQSPLYRKVKTLQYYQENREYPNNHITLYGQALWQQ